MGILFNRMREPVFLKEGSDARKRLERIRELEPLLNPQGQAIIRQDMKYLEYGIAGEENILFELKNSHMPMYVLHDVYLKDGDLSVQIDYLVFTRKLCFVIECKNLYGNIEITNTGDFVRTMKIGNRWVKEGIYSPVTQNQRHLELMKKINVDAKKNIISRFTADRYFSDFNKSVVVLANPKTVLNTRFAKKEVKDQVIRSDQLIQYIKKQYEQSRELPSSDEEMLAWAQSYLKRDVEPENDYMAKYEPYKLQKTTVVEETPKQAVSKEEAAVDETEVFKQLKAYRLKRSREENIKPYYIYNDNQLRDLIGKMPRNKAELMKVSGFGEAKAKKYGDDILRILGGYNSGVY